MRKAAVLVLLLALAGCAGKAPTEDGGAPGDPAEPGGTPFHLDCGGECGQLTDLDGSSGLLGEPDAAVDAADPRRMAVVAQTTRPAPLGDSVGVAVNSFVLFVTQDGGATWGQRSWPSVAGRAGDLPRVRLLSDPTVAFAGGRLAVAGMATDQAGWLPFAAVSEDMGATWAHVTTFEPATSADRPWMEAQGDLVAVVWTNLRDSEFTPPGWAWSQDGGATWTTGIAELPVGTCEWELTRPLVRQDGFTFGCNAYVNGTFVGGRVFGWTPAAGLALQAQAEPRLAGLKGLAERAAETWVLHGNSESFGVSRTPFDGPPVPLDDVLGVEDGWSGRQYTAFAADEAGTLHLLLRELVADAAGFRYGRVAYASWSPEAGVLDERVLLDEVEGAVASPWVRAATVIVDDHHDITFAGGRGLAVWGGDGALHWATLSPA